MTDYDSKKELYFVEWKDQEGIVTEPASKNVAAAAAAAAGAAAGEQEEHRQQAAEGGRTGGGSGGGGSGGGGSWQPRINVMFLAEDPFNFARRVAAAHALRNKAEILLVSSSPLSILLSLTLASRNTKLILIICRPSPSKTKVAGEMEMDYLH